jgi:RNA polymerase sigma-70 factor (ECF subfamily)
MDTPSLLAAAPDMTASARRRRFEALLARHRGIVLKIAHAYARDAEDRRDLAQEIALQLWKSFPRWDEARPFATWMYRVALNVALSHRRSAGARPAQVALEEAGECADASEASREAEDGLRALHRCIGALGALDRALLLLTLDERSQREIGEILGLGESNVATRLGRLKRRIRQQLQPDWS